MNATPTTPTIYCGVDTHADTHHVAIITDTGAPLDRRQFDATAIGYHDLETWIFEHGHPITVGVEGTASYGAGLTRHLLGCGISVLEVPRPDRKLRRNSGKSDPIDAEAAARAVLTRKQLAAPKRGDGPIESIRALRVARCGAVKAATASMNAVQSMIVTAPESLRTELRGHSAAKLLYVCAAFESDLTALHEPAHAIKLSLRTLACRTRELRREVTGLKQHLATLVDRIAPRTLDVFGLGPDTVAAADHHRRQSRPPTIRIVLRASLRCCPDPRVLRETNRHRLHRGGDRRANQALHTAVVVRLRYRDEARRYAKRRTSEGKPMPEIIRCQKRYLAREVFSALRADYQALIT